MTINTVNDYIKSVTLNDSGKTKVLGLEKAALKSSKLLNTLSNYTLTSKYTYIPFLHIPDAGATSYTIGSIKVVKELKSIKAKLTDETDEDTAIDMESALDSILMSQIRLVAEKYIAETLSNDTNYPPATSASAPSFATIITTLGAFPNQVISIEGKFVALVSASTYFTILATMTGVHKDLIKEGLITIIPVNGLSNTKMVVLHTQGVAYGLNIKGLEKQRFAGAQYSDLVSQISVGAAADANYIKNINLTA